MSIAQIETIASLNSQKKVYNVLIVKSLYTECQKDNSEYMHITNGSSGHIMTAQNCQSISLIHWLPIQFKIIQVFNCAAIKGLQRFEQTQYSA